VGLIEELGAGPVALDTAPFIYFELPGLRIKSLSKYV
jgi:hypothetical protein